MRVRGPFRAASIVGSPVGCDLVVADASDPRVGSAGGYGRLGAPTSGGYQGRLDGACLDRKQTWHHRCPAIMLRSRLATERPGAIRDASGNLADTKCAGGLVAGQSTWPPHRPDAPLWPYRGPCRELLSVRVHAISPCGGLDQSRPSELPPSGARILTVPPLLLRPPSLRG